MRGDSRTGDEPCVGYVTARLPALRRAAFLLCGGDAHRDDVVQATIVAGRRTVWVSAVGGANA